LVSFETSDSLLEEFDDELALLDPFPPEMRIALACLPPPGDDDVDKSFLKEDVQEENFQVYSNPLFEFDDNYNSSDINPLFNETLEDVESKDSNVSNFDEPILLNTPLFDEDECFDPEIWEKIFSPSYVRLSSKDLHYFFFIIVFSFGSEDTIFDPGIYAFHFSFLEPVAFESQMEVCSSTCFIPMDK
ncbi:hypothetical protein Tco_1188756, partial [Tanacetum coccineum]